MLKAYYMENNYIFINVVGGERQSVIRPFNGPVILSAIKKETDKRLNNSFYRRKMIEL